MLAMTVRDSNYTAPHYLDLKAFVEKSHDARNSKLPLEGLGQCMQLLTTAP